jgi:hypothetical protein
MLRCAKAGVRTPCVYMVDQQRSRIYMEKIEGHTLKHFLRGHYDDGTGQYDGAALALVVRACVGCGLGLGWVWLGVLVFVVRLSIESDVQVGPHSFTRMHARILFEPFIVPIYAKHTPHHNHLAAAAGAGHRADPRRRGGARGLDHLQLPRR